MGLEADLADIQDFAAHVLHKEARLTSRFTSFTSEVKIARRFTSMADSRFIRKVEMARLKVLESEGAIRIWHPDQVFEELMIGASKLAKKAADVRAATRRNREVLIEGQVSEEAFALVYD